MSIITSNIQSLRSAGKFKAFDGMSKCLCKFHIIDSQNTSDQVTNNRSYKRVIRLHSMHSIHS